MDCLFSQVYTGESCTHQRLATKVTVPVDFGERRLYTLMDSGFGQTLVQQRLVLACDQTLEQVCLQCIHGDVKTCPLAHLALTVDGVTWRMPIDITQNLPYLVIFGQNWPEFLQLLQTANLPDPERR